MNTFKGQVAIVTGAGSGIGHQIACDLADANANVVINDIDDQLLQTTITKINSTDKGRATAIVGDSGDIQVIDALIDAACTNFGGLDMAIANAGITTFGSFLDYPIDQFQRLVDVNLRGTFYLAQRAAKQIIQQNNAINAAHQSATVERHGGRLLLMSSVTGIQYHPDLTAYGMSKAAIQMMAKSLGVELGSHGITVNAIAPGATITERTQEDGSYESVWAGLTPTGRASSTADISNTALFLLSDAASQITGQTLVVDGGWTAVSPPPD